MLVSNAAFQMTRESLGEISDDERAYTFRLNIGAYFRLVKAAIANSSTSLTQLLGERFPGQQRGSGPDLDPVDSLDRARRAGRPRTRREEPESTLNRVDFQGRSGSSQV